MTNLNDLIKIADVLDARGLTEEADFVDSLVKSAAQSESAVKEFVDDLKKVLNHAAVDPKYSAGLKSSLPEVFKLIDEMVGYKSYVNPHVTTTTVKEMTADSLANLVSNIVQGQANIESVEKELAATTDPQQKALLEIERRKYQEEVRHRFGLVSKLTEAERREFNKLLLDKRRQLVRTKV